MSTILVIAEQDNGVFRKGSVEAVSQARQLADKMDAQVVTLALAANLSSGAKIFADVGSDRFIAVQGPQYDHLIADSVYPVALAVARETGAELILLSATTLGKDLAPKLAVTLDAALVSDCTGLHYSDGQIEVERPLYAGKVMARALLNSAVKIISLRPNVFEIAVLREGADVTVELRTPPSEQGKVELVEFRRTKGAVPDVAEADIIVTGGRGMRGPDNFKMLEELAHLLGGAVGATRAAVDSKWRPHSDQVGQTGKVVSPTLYIMCGASGSVQHWAGMSGSKCIVAVNRDADAPIISRADYSIIGDLFEILPVLIEKIRAIKS